MQELLTKIQESCHSLDWPVLFVPGVIAILVGLFLWLGGKRYSAFIIGAFGAALGALIGFLFHPLLQFVPFYVPAIAGAIVFGVLFVLLQQFVIFATAATICAAAFGFGYLSYAIEKSQNPETTVQAADTLSTNKDENKPDSQISPADQNQPPTQLTEEQNQIAQEYLPQWFTPENQQEAIQAFQYIRQQMQNTASTNKTNMILITVLGAAIGLAIAVVLKSFVMAICCSIVGSTSIVLGVIAVLLSKDATPITALMNRPKVLPAILIAMIIVGFTVQLLLARVKKPQPAEAEESDKE
ncbi:MAG: hypothetical protein JW936_00550 [Sedimentisphaerales bacterium]|nr:hypothetical protein [Sedimentisphaerales bacterium]